MVSVRARYEQALKNGYAHDSVQEKAVAALDALAKTLTTPPRFWQKTWQQITGKRPNVKGLYFWGGVGRGKTWLMDMFYESLPFDEKLRQHFHHFCGDIQKRLVALSGQTNPLVRIADEMATRYKVICFDEFFVSNVSDAMILGDLFVMLFDRGVALVATSNIAPDGLYQNGIHRDRFLPAIDAIKAHTTVMNIDAGVDYRLRALGEMTRFDSTLDGAWAARVYEMMTSASAKSDTITIGNRPLKINGADDKVLWVDFRELCLKPVSAADFIEIAQRFDVVIVDSVPILDDNMTDAVRRFIYLVDEFYDQGVLLFVSSADDILTLYRGQKLAFEIERTRSRLLQMQSNDYKGRR